MNTRLTRPQGRRGGRIDDKALYRLLVERGASQKQAAEFFGVSEAAVSKRLKLLKWNLTRHVGLERAREVADRGLDVFAQLQRINHTIRDELAWATQAAREPGGDRKGLQQVIVDLVSEIRKQLGFQLDVLRSLHDMRAVADFQQEVLDAIQEAAPEVRERIVQRLAERRTLRRTVSVPALGG